MAREIGGYFEAESSDDRFPMHNRPLFYTGRACLAYLIERIRPKRVFLPYYACGALAEPFLEFKVPIERYSLNEHFEISDRLSLAVGEILVYVNYFGLKSNYAGTLVSKWGSKVWLDNSQAFFDVPHDNVPAFNSARKFLGVPDGAYLLGPTELLTGMGELPRFEPDLSYLFARRFHSASEGYEAYRRHENQLDSSQYQASSFSEWMLGSVDYRSMIRARQENFRHLDSRLKASNRLNFQHMGFGDNGAPYAYPFLTEVITHQQLWSNRVYAPVLWTDCESEVGGNCFGVKNYRCLLPLPIDHRYSIEDMDHILSVIEQESHGK
jgi:hypothetical protein